MRFVPARPLAVLALAAAAATTPLAAQSFEIEETTIADVHAAMRAGRLTCVQLVQGYLDRIEAYDDRGPLPFNSVHTVNPNALEEARRLDQAFRSDGPVGPLHCAPVLLKDQVETKDMRTTYGSILFADFVPQRDATIVTRMKDAGAIILAKTNLGEFASRYVGSGYGVIRNAYDPTRNPSGSSGGTGTAVAANFGLIGIGEDTGGSTRGPAAVSALVGLRPTTPLVSRFGMMPGNPSNDTMGPMTRTVRDAALLLDAIAGYDPNDPITAYTVGEVPDSYAEGLTPEALRGTRIGVIRAPMDPDVDTTSTGYRQVRAVMDRAVADLARLGAVVVDGVAAEVAARVSEVSGLGGFETEQAVNAYLAQHPNAPYRTVREMVLSGKVVPSRGWGLAGSMGKRPDHAEHLPYLLAKEEMRVAMLEFMAEHELDAVVYATFDHPPTTIPDDVLTSVRSNDGYGMGNNRSLSPVLGFPALTVPAGFTPDGLPVGLELLGRPFTEAMLLELGYAYEQGTKHRKPPTTTPPLRASSAR